MERIVQRPGALDVHKASVTACVRVPGAAGKREEHTATFATTVPALLVLADWLEAHAVTQVAMEATGVYWKPVWAVLEDRFKCLLVNARDVKQVTWVQHCASSWSWLSNSPVWSGFTWIREAFSLAALDVHGGDLAALDLVQHGLTGERRARWRRRRAGATRRARARRRARAARA